MSTIVKPPEMQGALAAELHRLSIPEYHRLIESGGLAEGARIELIDGLIVDMSPRTPQHENAVRWLSDWVIDHLDRSRWRLMIGGPLAIGSSEPEPDLAIVERRPPALTHPSHAALVIEVALTSKDRDLRVKPTLYAPAVCEYWVVDLQARAVVVHREPTPSGYQDVDSAAGSGGVAPRSLDLGRLPVGALFAAAFAESPAARS